MSLIMPTRILVVGSGGREHALAWKLAGEPGVNEIVVAPGSAGIAEEPRVTVAPIAATDVGAMVELARSRSVELVVVGPEAPLAAGLADALIEARIPVFGPTRAASAIEWSKAFCHEVAASAGVRMAASEACTTRATAERAIARFAAGGTGFVVKEDGLAGGKGVTVFGPDATPEGWAPDLLDALYPVATPERPVLVEERLFGREASVIAVCDGERAIVMPAARDHKRLGDGEVGPNTGGMGAYSPLVDLEDDAVERIVAEVHRPILDELARRGATFRGFLYAGLILTAAGPVLLECNARLGDPEAQVILARLGGALGPVLLAAANGALPPAPVAGLPVMPGATVGIVLAGERYPADRSVGAPISGIDAARDLGALVFHAGTSRTVDGWATDGGRILTVVGRGPSLEAARTSAEAAADRIRWPGLVRRHDIAADLPTSTMAVR